MKEKKNIDRLFQEKFKEFEKEPPESVWKNIKRELKQDQRKKVLLPLWSKIAGVAALIALLFLVGRGVLFDNAGVTNHSNKIDQTNTTRGKAFENITNSDVESQREPTYSHSQDLDKSASEQGNNVENKALTTNSEEEKNVTKTPFNKQTKTSIVNNSTSSKTSAQKQSVSKSQSTSSENKKSDNERVAQHNLAPKEKQKTEQNTKLGEFNSKTSAIAESDKSKNESTQQIDFTKNKEQGNKENQDNLFDKIVNSNENKTLDPSKSNPIAQNEVTEDEENSDTSKNTHSIYDDIAKNEDEDNLNLKQTHEGQKRLALRPNIAPIYYNSLTGGSALDPGFSDNKSEGEVTMSFGVDVAYAVSERFKIRSGINKINMSYNTMGIAYTVNTQSRNIKGLSSGGNTQDIALVRTVDLPKRTNEVNHNLMAPYTEAKLNQQLEYLEVPFEVEYALLNQRFSINIIGGASTLFLTDNAVHLNSSMGTASLGGANNLNSVSFTTNVGLGFDYRITNTLNFNLEPTFKYQVNGFSGPTGGFNPYYFGIYTGMSFKF